MKSLYKTMNNIVGSRWWKFDFHAHSPASLDYRQKDISPRDWLLGHIEHGIECIAVTDHNTSGWIDCLQQEAQRLIDLACVCLSDQCSSADDCFKRASSAF